MLSVRYKAQNPCPTVCCSIHSALLESKSNISCEYRRSDNKSTVYSIWGINEFNDLLRTHYRTIGPLPFEILR